MEGLRRCWREWWGNKVIEYHKQGLWRILYMPTVNEIRTFPFTEEGLEQVRATKDGKNWPVVYLIHDNDYGI